MPDGKCPRSGPSVLRLETLVTTQNTHPENNDWQEPVVEQLSVSEISTPPEIEGASSEEAPAKAEEIQSVETQTEATADE